VSEHGAARAAGVSASSVTSRAVCSKVDVSPCWGGSSFGLAARQESAKVVTQWVEANESEYGWGAPTLVGEVARRITSVRSGQRTSCWSPLGW
jgi:hypothetical protein